MQPNSPLQFDLVVPLYNEEKNVELLVDDIEASGLLDCGLRKVVLVDNGSMDGTGAIVDKLATTRDWIKAVSLAPNQMYGGGVYEGLVTTEALYIGIIPGDRQISPQVLKKVWLRLCEVAADSDVPLFVKGHRTIRHDGFVIRLASVVYTMLANIVLKLGVKDVNGHPKVFHRDMLKLLPETRLRTFTFDAQLLENARSAGWRIIEVPVEFLARRAGVSSWSQKRMHTYKETASQIFLIRRLREKSRATTSKADETDDSSGTR